MREKIKFPVYVREVETGDIDLYCDINELRLVVEEFWDILEKDFKFWDRDGFPISFERPFVEEKDDTITKSIKNEEQLLKSYLLKYADKKGIHIENRSDMSLVHISDFLKNG